MQACTPTLPRLVGTRFQVLFHSAPAVLFTIPSRYYPLSVTREYLGLAGGPAGFARDFSGPVLLGIATGSRRCFVYGGATRCAAAFNLLRLHRRFLTPCQLGRTDWPVPRPRVRNACRLLHVCGLASSA